MLPRNFYLMYYYLKTESVRFVLKNFRRFKIVPAPMISRASTNKRKKTQSVKTTRTTVIIPTVLDDNLELYCLKNGFMKTRIFTMAVSDYLRDHGVRPDRPPKW